MCTYLRVVRFVILSNVGQGTQKPTRLHVNFRPERLRTLPLSYAGVIVVKVHKCDKHALSSCVLTFKLFSYVAQIASIAGFVLSECRLCGISSAR